MTGGAYPQVTEGAYPPLEPEWVDEILLAGAADDVRVLVKGSRFNRLERVVEAVAGDALPNTGGH